MWGNVKNKCEKCAKQGAVILRQITFPFFNKILYICTPFGESHRAYSSVG